MAQFTVIVDYMGQVFVRFCSLVLPDFVFERAVSTQEDKSLFCFCLFGRPSRFALVGVFLFHTDFDGGSRTAHIFYISGLCGFS
jgi:hypothetical protein